METKIKIEFEIEISSLDLYRRNAPFLHSGMRGKNFHFEFAKKSNHDFEICEDLHLKKQLLHLLDKNTSKI